MSEDSEKKAAKSIPSRKDGLYFELHICSKFGIICLHKNFQVRLLYCDILQNIAVKK